MAEPFEVSQLADEVLADTQPAGSHERKLARYAAAVTRQRQVADYILHQNVNPVTGETKLGSEPIRMMKVWKALDECGSFLQFRHYFTRDVYKLIAGCTCKKHLLCALCAIRRAAKLIAMYSAKISQVKAESSSNFDEWMITWTVRNGEDLAERFDHLIDCMKRHLHKRRNAIQSPNKTDCILKAIEAAVYSYEVTHSEAKGFHPHCHMVAMVPRGLFEYQPLEIKGKTALVPVEFHRQLVKEWQEITGDSFIVDVRLIESDRMPEPGEDIEGTRLKALIEVFKYALKMNRLSKDHGVNDEESIRIQVEAYEILKGRRLVGSFGQLRGLKVPENLNDEPITDEELPFVDLVYQYSGVTFSYELTTHSEAFTELYQEYREKRAKRRKDAPETLYCQEDVDAWLEKKNRPFEKMVEELEWL